MSPLEQNQRLEHLFRHESGNLIAILTKILGPQNLALVEDVVQDSLLRACELWKYKGIPDNPTAWLFKVARNKALDFLRKNRYQQNLVDQLSPLLRSEYTAHVVLDHELSKPLIQDEQLRMMFVCAHPSIPLESQVALILKTLCGFSIAEIARAFVTQEETIQKRLFRAREKLRNENIQFELPASEQPAERIDGVHTAIYLLFNEGYHSTDADAVIRDDLIEESLRLANMLVSHPFSRTSGSYALMALLCLQSARVLGRVNANGWLLTLRDQDRSRWNEELISKGKQFLNLAAEGETVTAFHLEAAIAYEHCKAKEFTETNWEKIDQLYTWLSDIKASPIVTLSHAVVQAERYGPMHGLDFLEQNAMPDYNLFHAAKGKWFMALGNNAAARESFLTALQLTHSPKERLYLTEKLKELDEK